MYLDTEFPVNLGQVSRVVDEAEVFVFGFLLFAERLLVDARASLEEGPLVAVVAGVSSTDERYESLRRLRPSFPMPEKFVFLVWPRSVSSLETLSVWARLLKRLEPSGPQTAETCRNVLAELQRLEKEQVAAAIKGQGFRSIWERKGESA